MVSLSELRLRAVRARIAEVASIDVAAERLGAIRLRPHQRLAVALVHRALAREGGCLLADDVGRGKTYVALSVARAWQRPLVVVPASLRRTWQRAMERSGVSCALVTHEALSRGRAPPLDPDGIIVDESHHFRSRDARRHAALARVAAHAPVLLLSATPLQNAARDLASQLAFFLGSSAYLMDEQALARHVLRSPGRSDAELPTVAPPAWVRTRHDDHEVLERLLAIRPPPRPFDAGDAGALRTVALVRAWASSRAALAAALRRRRRLATALEQCASGGLSPSRRDLRAWNEVGHDVQLALAPLLVSRALDATGGILLAAIAEERAALDRIAEALAATADPDVARAAALRSVRAARPGERVLAFSEFATTVRAYYARLRGDAGVGMLTASEARIASGRLSRDALLQRFAPAAQGVHGPSWRERVTLLLTTDLLSEGVNLQDASVVVHLDLPWNPARLAQRVGRVRRPGGAEVVRSYLIAPPARMELLLRVESRLRAKLARAEGTIGPMLLVLPTPALVHSPSTHPAPASGSAQQSVNAEAFGVVDDHLSRWRRARSRSLDGNERAPLVAAVRTGETGWLAALDDGRLLARCGNAPPDGGAAVARAVPLVEGPPRTSDDDERSRALVEVQEWLAHERLALACGVTASRTALDDALERRIARTVRRASRHERPAVLALASRLRDATGRRRSLGAEREHEELMALHDSGGVSDVEWLERALVLAARDRSRRAESAAPRVVALVVLGGAPAATQRGDHRAIRPLGPTAQPAPSAANATLLYATGSTDVHVVPPSPETSVPVSPTASSRVPSEPGTNATADR